MIVEETLDNISKAVSEKLKREFDISLTPNNVIIEHSTNEEGYVNIDKIKILLVSNIYYKNINEAKRFINNEFLCECEVVFK